MNAALTLMTGVSLSFCVRDLCEGKVQIEQVQQIIASTKFETDAHFDAGIASYKNTYWRKHPEQAVQFARQLWTAGKIVQPRITGKAHPGFNNTFASNGAPSCNWFVGKIAAIPVAV